MSLAEFLTGGSDELAVVLWPLAAGIIVAMILSYFYKSSVGVFVKRLLDREAIDEQSALSFEELNIKSTGFISYSLKKDSGLARFVRSAKTVDEKSGEEKVGYYISEDDIPRASVYASDGTKGVTVILAIVLLAVLATVLLTLIPDLITMAQNAINGSK